MAVVVDVDSIKNKLDIEKIASDRGKREPPQPYSTDLELDEPQRDIVNSFRDLLLKSRLETQDKIDKNLNKLEELELQISDSRCESLPAKAKNKINQTFASYEQSLKNAYRDYSVNSRFFRAFKQDNKLDREAEYPESKTLHWAIICSIIVAESLANSYFFAQGSNFGFIGGIFQAMLVALVNVGFALVCGVYFLPLLNKQDDKGIKTHLPLAIVLIVVFMMVIFAFNLLVAHYREVISIDPIEAIIKAVPALLSSPLGIKNLDAWMLLGLGNLSALIATMKSYNADDPYPNYGRLDRKNKYLDKQYSHLKEDLKDDVINILNEFETTTDQMRRDFRKNVKAYRDAMLACEKTYSIHTDTLSKIQNSCNQLLKLYRDTNKHVRGSGSQPPTYFGEEYKFSKEDMESVADFDLSQQKKQADTYAKENDDLDKTVKKVHKKLHELSDEVLQQDFAEYIRRLEEEVNSLQNDEF